MKNQKFRFRKFFEKYAYFYNYNNKIFVTKKPLQAKRENNFTQEEEQEFKKIYCYLARIESHNQNEVYLYQRLAESIWRREKSFEELYSDLNDNLLMQTPVKNNMLLPDKSFVLQCQGKY